MLKTTWYFTQRKYSLSKVFQLWQIDTTAQGLVQAIAMAAKTMLRVNKLGGEAAAL